MAEPLVRVTAHSNQSGSPRVTGCDAGLLRSRSMTSFDATTAQPLLVSAMSLIAPLLMVTVRVSVGRAGSVMPRTTSLSLPLALLLETRRREESMTRRRAREAPSLVHVAVVIWLVVGVPVASWPMVITGDSSG